MVTGRIERFTETGLRLEDGREIEADVIVTATGLVLGVGPCDGRYFSSPAPADIALIETCHAGGACPSS